MFCRRSTAVACLLSVLLCVGLFLLFFFFEKVLFSTKTGTVMYSDDADADHRCHVSGPPCEWRSSLFPYSVQMRQSRRFFVCTAPLASGSHLSGVCAVGGVQEFEFHESRLQDCFSFLFAWFDSEYISCVSLWVLLVIFRQFSS